MRDLQLSPALDRGHFDLCSKSGLRHADRNGHVNIVALACEERMLTNVSHDEQIARFGSQASSVTFLWNTNAASCVNPGWNSHLDLLGLRRNTFPMAYRTRFATTSRAAAIRTFLCKLQPPARPHHLPRAFARCASNHRTACVARSLTARTLL